MNPDDATFTDNSGNFGKNTTEDFNQRLALKITDMLSRNYRWIRFVAITGVLFSLIHFCCTVILNPLDIFGLIASVLYFAASYYLICAYKEIKRSYESQQYKYCPRVYGRHWALFYADYTCCTMFNIILNIFFRTLT